MKTKSVTIQWQELADEYIKEVQDVTNKEMRHTAQDAVAQLKNTSPREETGKRKGRYARGWTKRDGDMETVVYNKTDWQLTHLLENGHAVVNAYGDTGARVEAIKHIEPVEQWCESELPMRISRGLK